MTHVLRRSTRHVGPWSYRGLLREPLADDVVERVTAFVRRVAG